VNGPMDYRLDELRKRIRRKHRFLKAAGLLPAQQGSKVCSVWVFPPCNVSDQK